MPIGGRDEMRHVKHGAEVVLRWIEPRTSGARSATSGISLALFVLLVLSMPLSAGARDGGIGQSAGDASPQTFDDYCRGDLPAERRSRFSTELDRAELALANQDLPKAETAMNQAFASVYRGGSESAISIKCLGESAASRWFDAQLELYRQQATVDARRQRVDIATIYATAADENAGAVAKKIRAQKVRRVVSSIQTLEHAANQIDNDRHFGAFILSQEEAILKTIRQALALLKQDSIREHQAALDAEAEAFNRDVTDQELAASDLIEGTQVLANSLAGVDIGSSMDTETMRLQMRVSESQEALRRARAWNLEPDENRQGMPSSKRALLRGDLLMERAEDETAPLLLRDASYRAASKYYEFGGFENEATLANLERGAIADALKAEQARQEEMLEEAKAKIRDESGSLRKAVQALEKSEAEKKTFKDEADALEDELGF